MGARSCGVSIREFLEELKLAGLRSLPGTAAEILDDEVRSRLCPDKITTLQWQDVVETAHAVGLRTTATIMFGHLETPLSWAEHLLRIRRIQQESGGFTEFVPLPFVHMHAPLYRKGAARPGPTFREALLMHAVARLALHPLVPNIQVSWTKLGMEGARQGLMAGANDLGGTLINESISRASRIGEWPVAERPGVERRDSLAWQIAQAAHDALRAGRNLVAVPLTRPERIDGLRQESRTWRSMPLRISTS